MNSGKHLIIPVLFVVNVYTEKCITPNNELAECISLFACPKLLAALLSNIEFYQNSTCGGDIRNPKVCCGSTSTFIQYKPETADKLLPSRTYCGLQHSDDFPQTTNGTVLTEFPWLARIQQRHGNVSFFKCTGSLINKRYVLAAAWCLTFAGEPSRVRLGEYHVSNKVHCIDDNRYYECNDVYEEFGIEKLIIHPNYTDTFEFDNIGLIRLNRKAQYSDYIRPICLPLPGTRRAFPNEKLILGGWGLTALLGKEGWKKQLAKIKIYFNLITNEECETRIINRGFPLTKKVGAKLTCIESVNEDICVEMYIGTPLVFCHKHQWHQEAIVTEMTLVSFCTQSIVLTSVAYYVDWIKQHLEP